MQCEPHWPRLFVLGAQKAATTTLAASLQHGGASLTHQHCHRMVGMRSPMFGCVNGTCKENHVLASCLSSCSKYPRLFSSDDGLDATPDNLASPRAAGLLASMMPNELHARVRFIVSLREPVGRAHSWYRNRVEAALAGGPSASFGFCGQSRRGPSHIPPFERELMCSIHEELSTARHSPHYGSAIASGRYNESLGRWRKHWNRRQILVLNYGTLLSDDMQPVIESLRSFTGLAIPRAFGHLNERGGAPLHAPNASDEAMCTALDGAFAYYAPFTTSLYSMLENDHPDACPPEEPPFGRFPPFALCAAHALAHA